MEKVLFKVIVAESKTKIRFAPLHRYKPGDKKPVFTYNITGCIGSDIHNVKCELIQHRHTNEDTIVLKYQNNNIYPIKIEVYKQEL